VELHGSDKESARQQMDAACRKFLTNPVIEDFHLGKSRTDCVRARVK
jgi:phosphoribosylformylglycinamidine (FGAM) synthase PurS component